MAPIVAIAMALGGVCNVDPGTWSGDPSPLLDEAGVVMFRSPDDVSHSMARRILVALNAQGPLPGLPEPKCAEGRVRVSVVSDLDRAIVGRAYPAEGVIVLRRGDVIAASDHELLRIVRHELAHIALQRCLGPQYLPRWLDEGYAEWVTGGPSCLAQVRLAVELRERKALLGADALAILEARKRSTVMYYLYSSFVDYLERSSGLVSDGSLLRSIRRQGVVSGVQEAAGMAVDDLAAAWAASIGPSGQAGHELMACNRPDVGQG